MAQPPSIRQKRNMAQSTEQTPKKRYENPRLVRYGDLVEVTQSFGNMGHNDNAITGHNHKTG